jgi:hypothetical protein
MTDDLATIDASDGIGRFDSFLASGILFRYTQSLLLFHCSHVRESESGDWKVNGYQFYH